MLVSIEGVSGIASGWATLTLAVLMLLRHVLQPRLTDNQRRAFEVAILPLLCVFVVYVIADFEGALR